MYVYVHIYIYIYMCPGTNTTMTLTIELGGNQSSSQLANTRSYTSYVSCYMMLQYNMLYSIRMYHIA